MSTIAETTNKNDRPEWTAAKDIGTAGEQLVAAMLRQLGFKVDRAPDDVAGAHDLAIVGTIEVKTDTRAEHTGNIAVEVSHHGKPSGIATSRASAWCFVVGATACMLPTETLRQIVKTRYFKRVAAGEHAEVLLVPIGTIRAVSRIMTLRGKDDPR